MGIKEGSWVGLMLGNVPDFVILALALSKLDAAIVPIDPTTGARELELMLTATPLRALVTRPRGSEGAITASGQTTPAPQQPTPRPRASRTTVSPGAVTPSLPLLGAGLPGDAPEVRRRLQGTLLTCSVFKRSTPEVEVDPIAILFTADSLGDPKAVLRSEKNTLAAVDHAIEALALTVDSRILIAVPLFHAYGWDLGLLPTLKLGASMFLEEELSARRVGKLIRDHAIDVLPGTPQMYAELTRLPTAKKLEVEPARYLAAGSRLDKPVSDEFFEKYGVRIMSCYHSTEAATVAVDLTGRNPTSVGKLLDGVDVKVTDNAGAAISGKEGLLWVRSKALSPASLGPYDADAKDTDPVAKNGKPKAGRARAALPAIGTVDKQGWFRTGDLGKIDKNGRLYLTGREDDVVKVDGKRVALGEVESCLESFPKIKQAQAVVIMDPISGAMVIARVVIKSTCGVEEIIDHCARNLAPYKVPRRIEFCDAIEA
jgi:long-chain acyl-CoA synthetase